MSYPMIRNRNHLNPLLGPREVVEEFKGLPANIQILRHRVLGNIMDKEPAYAYGFTLGVDGLDGDEVFIYNGTEPGGIWGFHTLEQARAGAVSFFAGWCARIRYERRTDEGGILG